MKTTLLNPSDAPERSVAKLLKISEALMRRVELTTDEAGEGYAHFQRAVMLEAQVRDRTRDLERTLDLLNESNAQLVAAGDDARTARAALYNALEAVEEGFALFGPDDALVMCNSRFCEAAPDVKAALREGLNLEDYFDLMSRSEHLDQSEAGSDADWAARRMALREDGHAMFNIRFQSGVWLQVSEHRTPDGGAAILQTDVTDMIRLERAERDKLLDDQAQMTRATLDHIIQGVCIFDEDARLVGWNRRLGALLTPPMRLVRVGAPFGRLLSHIAKGAELSDGWTTGMVQSWAGRGAARAPMNFDLRRGGAILAVFAQSTPDGGFVMSFTDVTAERKAAEALAIANETLERRVSERTEDLEAALAEAERANASKTRFVAAASHDILQPLSAAKLFISSLSSMPLDAAPLDAVGRASSALGGVEEILTALLDVSRLDSARLDVKTGPTRLGDLLARLKDEFAPAAAAAGLSLRVRATDAVVVSDAPYLRRILQNLIGNALRYTRTGGVLVAARPEGDRVRVEVWDTGPGVPEDRRADIFKEFHRLDDAPGPGVGLGLTIVERACALLGHDLTLRSEVGRGSRFGVSIARAAEARRAAVGGTPAAAPAVGADILILIVESDPELSAALALQLETWGVSAFEAPDAAAALALLEETEVAPDMILSADRRAGGLETIDRVRALCGPVPAAVLASDRGAGLRADCLRRGVPVLFKPVAEAELFEFIAHAS